MRLVVVTGGPGVVKAAMDCGKKAIAAGPGNPPAVVDETADLDVAAAGIVEGRVARQQHRLHRGEGDLAVDSIADALLEQLGRRRLPACSNERQVQALEKVVLHQGDGGVHPTRTSSARTPASSPARSASRPATSCAC